MSESWALLTLEQQIYYGIAIIATLVVVLQTLMLFVGGSELVGASDSLRFDIQGCEGGDVFLNRALQRQDTYHQPRSAILTSSLSIS